MSGLLPATDGMAAAPPLAPTSTSGAAAGEDRRSAWAWADPEPLDPAGVAFGAHAALAPTRGADRLHAAAEAAVHAGDGVVRGES